ncbi:MAG: beta-lactamase family protein [Promicromonosporaceae bacterium]|nr:beta-lactamase family protein [Promicromonosporaceae bacterium]
MNVHDGMKRFNVPGVSVTYFAGDLIRWSKHYGTLEAGASRQVDDNSIFHACSISKMVTTLCVLRLAQDGLLDLHRDVNDYLTSWQIPDGAFTKTKKVTLANLLAHQGGFRDGEGSFGPLANGDSAPAPIDILIGATPYHPEPARVEYEPETDCEYSDLGYCVIAQVLGDVLGETVPQLAARLVFNPLGLTRTFFWGASGDPHLETRILDCACGHDNDGRVVDGIRAIYPNTEGASLWTTTRDLAQIVIDLLKAYHGDDGAILDAASARFMLSPYGCDVGQGVGVFLDRDEAGRPFFFSQGWGIGMQCKLRAYYQQRDGVVVMTNSEPGVAQDESLVGEIIRQVSAGHRL